MNHDQDIQNLIANIKADKSIMQPWRNKAAARMEEGQAFVRMGKTSTCRVEEKTPVTEPLNGQSCICVNNQPPYKANCLVHGL